MKNVKTDRGEGGESNESLRRLSKATLRRFKCPLKPVSTASQICFSAVVCMVSV